MRAYVESVPIGNLGNQMLQWMLLDSMKRHLGDLRVEGIDLPQWSLSRPMSRPPEPRPLTFIGQYFDVPQVESLIRRGWIKSFRFAALGFQMAHYDEPAQYAPWFPKTHAPVERIGPDCLLINVRGAEVLSDVHADYGPIPLAFYRQLLGQTGLQPVFMGQLGEDRYSQALQRAFPRARFAASLGPMADFELIRSAAHVVISVSTFSWLAAWLSDALTVHVPVLGMLNPVQRPDIDLLPRLDPRYRFYAFPVRRWSGTDAQFEALEAKADFPALNSTELNLRLEQARLALERPLAAYRRQLALAIALKRGLGIGRRVGLRLQG